MSQTAVALRGPLNVLMVNNQQTGGGAGRVGELLASALRQAGQHVRGLVRGRPDADPDCVLAGHWREAALARRLTSRGFPECGHASAFVQGCRAEFADADVLHCHNLHGDYVSIAALPVWGWAKPIVWTLHDCWPLTGNCATPHTCQRWRRACGRCPQVGVRPVGPVDHTSLFRRVKPALFRAAGMRLVTPSHWLAGRVREAPGMEGLPLRVIHNPIDTAYFAPTADRAALRRRFDLRADRPTIVLAAGTWRDPLKGADDAVAALRALRAQLPALQLLVIGEGSDDLLAAVGCIGCSGSFGLDRAWLRDAYAAADVCLFPSRAENYPNTVLEALACATPVVAYAVGGVPEQITPGRNGLLVEDGNARELGAALVRLVTDVPRSRHMGRAGRAFVCETCDPQRVAAAYLDEYARAIFAWCARRGRSSARYRRCWWARRVARLMGWERPCDRELAPDPPPAVTDATAPLSRRRLTSTVPAEVRS